MNDPATLFFIGELMEKKVPPTFSLGTRVKSQEY